MNEILNKERQMQVMESIDVLIYKSFLFIILHTISFIILLLYPLVLYPLVLYHLVLYPLLLSLTILTH